MADKSSTNRQEQQEAKKLLARTPVIRGACELDLLGFLQRHPCTLLTSEQLAVFVGYDVKHVAKAIDAFIDAGLLDRTRNPKNTARLYLLVLDGPQGGGLAELLELASRGKGRRDVLALLALENLPPPVDALP